MYDLTGRPNVFHVIALVNLATLAMGLLALRRWRRTREPGDLVTHQRRMAMNYVGLWMAFVTELLVNPMLGISRFSDARFIGKQVELAASWQATSELNLTASLSAFDPGPFIRDTGPARTIRMLGAQTTFRF